MYSEQLEQLIKSVTADGVVTEKERAVLQKRAEEEGIEMKEFDKYLDDLTNKMVSTKGNSVKLDMTFLTKVKSNYQNDVCLLGIKPCIISTGKKIPLQSLYANIVREEKRNDNDEIEKIQFYFVLYGYTKPKFSGERFSGDVNISLATEKSILNLKYGTAKHGIGRLKSLSGIEIPYDQLKCGNFFFYNSLIDEETLRIICDAEKLSIIFEDVIIPPAKLEDGDYSYNYKYSFNQTISNFVSYARIYYRSMIDNTAYPDAIFIDNVIEETSTDMSNKAELMKILNDRCIYYIGAQSFEIVVPSGNCLKQIGINFVNIVDDGKGAELGLGLVLYGIGKRLYRTPQLLFETDKGRLELSFDSGLKKVVKAPIAIAKAKESFYTVYGVDEDLLKLICDSKIVGLSIIGMEDYKTSKIYNIEKINISNIVDYAQVFYRSAVNESFYPNAKIDLDVHVEIENPKKKEENEEEKDSLKILTIPKKVMNKVALGHKYFEQFAIKNSNVQFIEFDEKYSLSGFNNCIKVFSILKEENPQFFLKVVYNYYIVKKNRKGEEETEKKVMNLNAGSLKIICDGYTEVKVSPLAKSKAIFDKDNEMNFYPISEQDMRTILAAENISISIYGSILKSENIRHIGLSTSLPFVWKQAFATLMGEEVPEKKTLFSKLKGFFK